MRKRAVFTFERKSDPGILAMDTIEKLKALGLEVAISRETEDEIEFVVTVEDKS